MLEIYSIIWSKTLYILSIQEQGGGSDLQDPHGNSDEEIVQQDAQFDYYTMPVDTNSSELTGKVLIAMIVITRVLNTHIL